MIRRPSLPAQRAPQIPPELAAYVLRFTTQVLAAWAVVFGAITAAGGRERWGSAPYRVALDVPGAPASWGLGIALAGALLWLGVLTAHRWLVVLSGLMGFFWGLGFGFALGVVAVQEHSFGYASVSTYWLLSLQFGVRAAVAIRWKL